MAVESSGGALPVESRMPGFAGASGWLNSAPLTPQILRGKVVAVQFWTFTCINWLRTLPYVRGWVQQYAEHGLVVVGVHTPEFHVEHDLERVQRAVTEMGIAYPVVLDNDYAIWEAFANRYWPALYLADAQGRIRHHHFGEGGYEQTEDAIRRLLSDAGITSLPERRASVTPRGIEEAADWQHLGTPETYLGLRRSEGFSSPESALPDEARAYSAPPSLALNEWALSGTWMIRGEDVVATQPGASIALRFQARDVNLILAPKNSQRPSPFRVTLDGQPPGRAHGIDVDEDGNGVVEETRLYQLIRQRGTISDRQFGIEFRGTDVAALCFTFG